MRQSWGGSRNGGERARGVRWGFARAVRQVFDALVAAGQPPPRAVYVPPSGTSLALPPSPPPEAEAARERARAILEQARAEMPSLMHDAPPPAPPEPRHIPAEAASLRQALRSYTDHVDRLLAAADEERRALREQVNRLSEELLLLRAEVTGLRALISPAQPPMLHQPPAATPDIALPAAPAMAEPRPPFVSEVPVPESPEIDINPQEPPSSASRDTKEASDSQSATVESPPTAPEEAAAGPAEVSAPAPESDELARFDARVFPAGTIGLLVALAPVDDFHRLTMIQERLGNEAGVESVELSSYELGEARLRLTFRMPARGRWLRDLLERVAGAPVDPTAIRFERGVVFARLLPGP